MLVCARQHCSERTSTRMKIGAMPLNTLGRRRSSPMRPAWREKCQQSWMAQCSATGRATTTAVVLPTNTCSTAMASSSVSTWPPGQTKHLSVLASSAQRSSRRKKRQTRSYTVERSVQKKPGGPLKNAFDMRVKNLANTNVVVWGDRLHALYEAGVPYELDPATLATLCSSDMEGCLPSLDGYFFSSDNEAMDKVMGFGGWAFTAHPHIDPNTMRMCGFAWQMNAVTHHMTFRFAEWSTGWERVSEREYVMKNCENAPHDFGVTASRYIMVQNRFTVEPLQYVLGLQSAVQGLKNHPELPVLVHVVPRDPKAPTFMLEGPKDSFEIHVCFAHDGPPIGSASNPADDSHIVTMYTAGWDRLPTGSFLSEWGTENGVAPDFNKIPRTVLWRYVVDTRSGNVTRTLAPGCENVSLDHPHINPRFMGSSEARYVYAILSNEVSSAGPPRGYVRLDLLTGERDVWYAPSGRLFVEEPIVIEKAAAARYSAKDTGEVWVVGMCTDMDEDGLSSLIVLDGARLADGPVARVRLNHKVWLGLHGSFAPGFHSSKALNVDMSNNIGDLEKAVGGAENEHVVSLSQALGLMSDDGSVRSHTLHSLLGSVFKGLGEKVAKSSTDGRIL
eukprot:gnl/TRDRNA2_/TRDRNA2_174375_c0_seq1.p1 gnl/TRDRNA2_/TRDRNA2_174375_c0~~gnl/TRDRNA2_/TRDRNA2_174375_c0_seq1.p1  ORF type:complete len:617 (+),score=63.14 gnl/TRDRNA2_/TRDRNA2_174375_c0_seq1:430-2280(+)